MKIKYLYIFLLFSILLSSCRNFAEKRDEKFPCLTYISGKFVTPLNWKAKLPALLPKRYGPQKILYGQLVERTKEGIIFDPDKDRLADLPPKLYKWDEITFFINDKAEVEYGKIPESMIPKWKLTLMIASQSNPESSPIYLELPANTSFEYCLKPDKYKILTFILEKSESQYEDRSEQLPDIYFEVKNGLNNYIGDLVMDDYKKFEEGSHLFHFTPTRRPSDSKAATYAMFGLIGLIASELSKSDPHIEHNFYILDSLKHNEKINKSLIYFK